MKLANRIQNILSRFDQCLNMDEIADEIYGGRILTAQHYTKIKQALYYLTKTGKLQKVKYMEDDYGLPSWFYSTGLLKSPYNAPYKKLKPKR